MAADTAGKITKLLLQTGHSRKDLPGNAHDENQLLDPKLKPQPEAIAPIFLLYHSSQQGNKKNKLLML